MNDSRNAPGWFEKRLAVCWLFGWAFVLSIFTPAQTITAVHANLEEIIKEDHDQKRTRTTPP